MTAIILFLQIVIESLPISSSGHLTLVQNFFKHAHISEQLEHLAHIPTLIILAFFFRKQWLPLLKNLSRNFRVICKIIFLTAIVDSITAIFFLAKKTLVFPDVSLATPIGFFITAFLLFSLSWNKKTPSQSLTPTKSVILGIAQGIALLPGVSRFATTYVVARWLAIPHRRAFEISFLIEVPLIAAASLRALTQPIPEKTLFYSWQTLSLVIMAILVGYYLLAFAERLAAQNKLWKFGIYVLIVGLLLLTTTLCQGEFL